MLRWEPRTEVQFLFLIARWISSNLVEHERKTNTRHFGAPCKTAKLRMLQVHINWFSISRSGFHFLQTPFCKICLDTPMNTTFNIQHVIFLVSLLLIQIMHINDNCLQTWQRNLRVLFHPPIRSVMVSEPWLCSLLSVSSAACRLMHSFSRLSLLRSSRQHLSCSSRTLASSCCSCLLLSVWALRSLVAASVSARNNVLASSS